MAAADTFSPAQPAVPVSAPQPGPPAAIDVWLGTGVPFPLRPDASTRQIDWLSGMELVRQSIETILDTEPGERVMLPAFGCGLRRFLMAPNTATTRTAIQQDVAAALNTWEPRIQVTEVSVTPADDEPALVWIDISYIRLADLRQDNLVYPFYLK